MDLSASDANLRDANTKLKQLKSESSAKIDQLTAKMTACEAQKTAEEQAKKEIQTKLAAADTKVLRAFQLVVGWIDCLLLC